MDGTLLLLATGEIVVITADRGPDFYAATVLHAPSASSYQPGGYAIQITSADIDASRTIRISDELAEQMKAQSTRQLLAGKMKPGEIFFANDTEWTITAVLGLTITATNSDGDVNDFPWHEARHGLYIHNLHHKFNHLSDHS